MKRYTALLLVLLQVLVINGYTLEQTTYSNATCKIKLLDEDRSNYEAVMAGFVQGMYRTPPNPCTLCQKLAVIAGQLQVNFITLEKNRDKWINIADVLKLDFFTQLSRLLTLVTLFGSTAISIDQIFKDAKIMGLIDLTVKRIDPSYMNQMQMNVLDNISQLTILWSLSPGASCHGLGVRAGTTVKRLLKISFESIDESKYTNTTNTTVLMSESPVPTYLY